MSIPEIIKSEYASSGIIKKYLLIYKLRCKTANIFNKKFLSNDVSVSLFEKINFEKSYPKYT